MTGNRERLRGCIAGIPVTVGLLVIAASAAAQELRPVRDDVGYCWDPAEMQRLVRYLDREESPSVKPEEIVAGISPHDDYLYAGRIYYPLFLRVRAKEAVIFGVTHATVRKEIGDPQKVLILEEYRFWRGPRKNVAISPLRDFIRNRLDTSLYIVDNKAHRLEHSIEALVPFLQYFNPDIRITPIMVTAMPFERMEKVSRALGAVIAEYLQKENLIPGKDIVFLMSSDANHYGADFNNIPFGEDSAAHRKGIEQDRRISAQDLAGDVTSEKLRRCTEELKNVVWCGKYSVPLGLLTAAGVMERLGHRTLTGTILRYSDTYTEGVIPIERTSLGTTAPFSLKHWVGFFSAAYVQR